MSQASGIFDQPKTLEGGCLCGEIRYTFTLPAGYDLKEKCEYCHCIMCRKSCGGMISAFLSGVPADSVVFHKSRPSVYESSKGCHRGFCQKCGAQIYFQQYIDSPQTYGFTVGSLDDPDSVTVYRHSFTEFGVKGLKELMHVKEDI
ncbi:uncharacterized protein VTP21DRAFT_7446 [Calcarisporiella thermophila]|uniref:uncharacterized protein n=1 Tax=Calcarisporiella thermophila TaxID=911321 RepID=UPI0037448321